MPYILSPKITTRSMTMWGETSAYEKKTLYFMTAFPLPLEDASESPVVPVLFTRDDMTM